MAHSELIDAFNDCVDRVQSGQRLEDCLRRYPQYANELRALLEVGWAVSRAAPELSVAARARMRSRVLAAPYAVASPAGIRRTPRAMFRSVTMIAAVLLLVMFAGLLILMLNRDDTPQLNVVSLTPQITATPSATPTPRATVTPTITPSATPTVTATMTASMTTSVTVFSTAAASSTSTSNVIATMATIPTLEACRLDVTVSSANLRSGPGTGYGVEGYAFAGETFVVLSAHTSGTWYEIQAETDSAWISATVGVLSGSCETLPVSAQTYLEASSANSGTGDDSLDDASSSGDDNSGSGSSGSGSDDSSDDSGDNSGDDGDDGGSSHDSEHDSGDDGDDAGGDDHPDEPDDD